MPQYADVAEQAARAAGRVLLEMLGRAQVFEKGPKDMVTEADRMAQSVVQNILLNAFPDHGFVGEEDDHSIVQRPSKSGLRWIVDPLDGTANYIHGMPGFAVSIALEQNGDVLTGVVLDPMLNECYVAIRGEGAFLNGKRLQVSKCQHLRNAMVAASFPANVERSSPEISAFAEVLVASQSVRRLGSAALNLCYLASARADAYWATSVKSWDVAAGILLVQEAGGIMTAVDGSTFVLAEPKFIAAATKELHAELMAILASIWGMKSV
jgi:myo-inositol-1(or 4)-monophosphatase